MTRVQRGRDAAGVPYYTLHDDALEAGASLGNSAVFVPIQARGALAGLFCIASGALLMGSFSVRYGVEADGGYVPVEPQEPAAVTLHPAYQRRALSLGPDLVVSETAFVPLGGEADPPLAYVVCSLHNSGPAERRLRVLGVSRLAGGPSGAVRAAYDHRSAALVASDVGNMRRARALGASCAPVSWAVTADWSGAYDPWALAIPAGAQDTGDTLGLIAVDLALLPGAGFTFAFLLAVSARGGGRALEAIRAGRDHQAALARTVDYLAGELNRSRVLTPDPLINDGATWSKVNMRRVMARSEQGAVFSNDPGRSSAVVGRDAAWFCYGADHAWPAFSRELLENFVRMQDASGKIPEYFHSVTGSAEDDGLNINDDTPLFILACAHHARCTGDQDWVREVYPAVAKAARCLLANRDRRGLVYCSAEDPRGNVWASATWRNIIPGYSLNGAVTEINAEAVAALRAASELASLVPEAEAEGLTWAAEAAALQAAMDKHLLNPQNGLYYLNIDTGGVPHADVTGDLVFPVLFEACSEETARRITRRLGMADLWTSAGLRTVSLHDPRYDPSAGVGLLGGVWPGLTWWYAFSCRRHHPEMMARALRSSFAHYAAEPRATNTVPGQFSEWFDGQSLANRGMRLSPWEPPRFLWAAVEGVCGFEPTLAGPRVDPVLPPGWSWVGLRRLPLWGSELSYAAVWLEGCPHVWATQDVWAPGPLEVYAEDVSEQVRVCGGQTEHLALRRPGEVFLFLGQVGVHSRVTTVDLAPVWGVEPATVSCYESAQARWAELGPLAGPLALAPEPGGFCLVRLRGAAA